MTNLLRRCRYFVLSLLFLTSSVEAQNEMCSERTRIEELVRQDDLFIGEVHGTVEVSRFFKCVIEESIEVGDEEIVVSLEMPELATNPSSSFWRSESFEDGRSSEAMFSLVQSLVEMERNGLITLHFQLGAMGGRASPESTGKELRVLADKYKVIALAGNMHSRKRLPQGVQQYGCRRNVRRAIIYTRNGHFNKRRRGLDLQKRLCSKYPRTVANRWGYY